MNIVMVSAENDALPGGKVGGIGDVVRDIPPALAQLGQQVNVLTPAYGAFSRLPGAEHHGSIQTMFCDYEHSVELYKVPAKQPHDGVTQWVFEHSLFAAGGAGKIYCDDASDRPFATDASKFALFSAAVAKAIVDDRFGRVDVLHLHDWHAAMVAVLREFDPQYRALKSIRTVYTIHNLALQGVRPFSDDTSSLRSWFPRLRVDAKNIHDPGAPNCINPMRAGINLSDAVHVVSPTYAREILLPSNHQQGFFGGEGLHGDLQQADAGGRLHGILNGCEYPAKSKTKALSLAELLNLCEDELMIILAKTPAVTSTHAIACQRIARLASTLPSAASRPFLLSSVGRITDQKILLLRQLMHDGRSALEHLLDILAGSSADNCVDKSAAKSLKNNGLFILLGSGDSELEKFLTDVAARHSNFLYVQGYAEPLSQELYRSGDLFLMPSSFEPCGISQMLAMRAGQPCLVHGVGGLSDTINDGVDGFSFNGKDLPEQAQQLLDRVTALLQTWREDPASWKKIAASAAQVRFSWGDAAKKYIDLLYAG